MKEDTFVVDSDHFPEEVIVYDHVSMVKRHHFQEYIQHVDSTDYTLTVRAELLSEYDIEVGDVLVSDVGQGMLRSVAGITEVSDDVLYLHTEQATLEEVIKEGYINEQITLNTEMINKIHYHQSGIKLDTISEKAKSLTKDTMVWNVDADFMGIAHVTGGFSYSTGIDFELDMRRFIRLNKFKFGFTTTADANLNVVSSATASLQEDFSVATVYFTPIVIPAGPIVIVVTPILDISVYFDGNAEATITTSYGQEIKYEAYILYNRDDKWGTYTDLDNNYWYNAPSVSATATAEAGMTGTISMLLYGVLGANVNASIYGELKVQPLDDPWWEIYAGYKIGIGAEATILWVDLIDKNYPDLLGEKWIIAKADGTHEPTGTIKGQVIDAVTGSGLSGVDIEVYNNQNLIASTVTIGNGNYSLNIPGGTDFHVKFIKDGYLTTDYYDIEVIVDEEKYLETVMQIDQNFSGNGTIAGKIINANTGDGIPGTTLQLREGLNANTGPIYQTASSDNNGNYSLSNIPAGNYTLNSSKTGYHDASASVISIGGQTQDNQNISMSPDTGQDVIQIILDWGAEPPDLDAHLTGPIPGSDSRFHIFWNNREFIYGGVVYVYLDHDVQHSYGPETITIHHETDGVYRYSVHDYTNRFSNYSYKLSSSSARARVFRDGQLVNTFHVPSNQEGTLWTVFEMNNGVISPINVMSYETDLGNINKSHDADLIQNIPIKD